ncbi:hypothetical protein BJX99DRAFT_263344 [Aspergillus californicus]
MPTATTTNGWTLANLGPAPTSITATPSCTPDNFGIASTLFPDYPVWSDRCIWSNSTSADCWPQPTDSALSAEIMTNRYILPFHSPGVECASGWKSVGAIEHPSNGPVTSLGSFTMNPFLEEYYNEDFTIPYPLQEAIGVLLDPGETAVACCPSSMTLGEYGGCYSALPSRDLTTGCLIVYTGEDIITSTTFVLNRTTTQGNLFLPMTGNKTYFTVTTSFAASETSEFMAATFAEPIYILHHASDVANASVGPSETGSEPDTGDNNTNAASGLHVGHDTALGGFKATAGILVLSFFAGMALVIW